MLRPPAAGYICPCCGVEFEVDDEVLSHEDLRKVWVSRGMAWFSRATLRPAGWNATHQLNRAGYGVDPGLVNPQVTSESRREIPMHVLVYRRRGAYVEASVTSA